MNRIRNVLLLPLGLLSILILFYVVAGALPLLDSLRASDFVFKSIPEGGAFDAIKWLSTTRIDWSVVLEAKDEIAGSGLHHRRDARHDGSGNRHRN
jgi:hypothetical protein